jgi:hypothetical protein
VETLTSIVVNEALRMLRSLSPGGKPFDVREPLVEDESMWFKRGIENGLVKFETCPEGCFRFVKWHEQGPDHFRTPVGAPRHMFSSPHAERPALNREYVPHIAAYARAVIEWGYDPARAAFSLYRKFSTDGLTRRAGTTYETDVEFYDASGRVHLLVEVKAGGRLVEQIVRHLDGATPLGRLPGRTAKELEYVMDVRPRYLWVTGPGTVDPARHVFAVAGVGADIVLARLDDLPPPTD